MESGICINCFSPKPHWKIGCNRCSFLPTTSMDLAVSCRWSHTFQTVDSLNEIAEGMTELNQTSSYFFRDIILFEDSFFGILFDEAITNTTAKYPMFLTDYARQSFFNDEVNVHIIGPSGYRAKVAKAREFDGFYDSPSGKHIFISETSDGCERLVSDRLWFLEYDLYVIETRRGDSSINQSVKNLDIFYTTVIGNLVSSWEEFDVRKAVKAAVDDPKFKRP